MRRLLADIGVSACDVQSPLHAVTCHQALTVIDMSGDMWSQTREPTRWRSILKKGLRYSAD